MSIDTLINFSGGVDSTFYLYQYLKNNPNKDLLVFHLKMTNFQGRQAYEYKAVKDILKWLSDHGYSNYKYLEAAFDYGDMDGKIMDVAVIAFMNGILLGDPKYEKIVNILSCVNRWDPTPTAPRIKDARAIRSLVLKSRWPKVEVKRSNFNFLDPYRKYRKSEMLTEMPRELFDLTWYCRQPQEGKTCGKCHACVMVDRALVRLKEAGHPEYS